MRPNAMATRYSLHFEEESAVIHLYKARLGKRDAFGACHPSVMIVSGLLQVRLNRKAKRGQTGKVT